MARRVKYDDGIYVGDTEGLFRPKRVGWGKMTYSNGDVYEGGWKNDKRDGEGKMTRANGDVSKGKWKDGRMVEGRVEITLTAITTRAPSALWAMRGTESCLSSTEG